jgi:hypothetical protein
MLSGISTGCVSLLWSGGEFGGLVGLLPAEVGVTEGPFLAVWWRSGGSGGQRCDNSLNHSLEFVWFKAI